MEFFVCPDTDVATGGVRVIYRAVDHLRAAGHDAVRGARGPGIPADVVTPWPRSACARSLPEADRASVPAAFTARVPARV